MPVIYNGKAIQPAPVFTYEREKPPSRDGDAGFKTLLTLKGTLVPYKGSPDSTGVWWTTSGYAPDEAIAPGNELRSIMAKQAALVALFASENGVLEVSTPSGSGGTRKFIVRSPKITFAEGVWVTRCDFTITLDATVVGDTATTILSCTDNWDLETLDEKLGTYRLTRRVQAQGRPTYDVTGTRLLKGWEVARDYVLAKAAPGINNSMLQANGVVDFAGGAYNYLRGQSADERGESFGLTETWLAFDAGGGGPATEDWNVNTHTSEDGRTSVSVEGTITGLEQRDNTTRELVTTRWANASAKWAEVQPALFARAGEISGATLNPHALSSQNAGNKKSGVLTFARTFDDRPLSTIAGSIKETVTVSTSGPADVFAQVPVLGRLAGPVLQGMGSRTVRSVTVSIEVDMPPAKADGTVSAAPDLNPAAIAYRPVGSQVFLERDEQSYSPTSGRATRSLVWVWQ